MKQIYCYIGSLKFVLLIVKVWLNIHVMLTSFTVQRIVQIQAETVSRIAQAWLDTLVCLPTFYAVLDNLVAIPKRGSGPRAKLTRTTDRQGIVSEVSWAIPQSMVHIYIDGKI